MQYRIENAASGVDLGIYEGDTEAEALDALARDAGYSDHAEACARIGDEDNLAVYLVDSPGKKERAMYVVTQTFETLGDPARADFATEAEAEAYAATLREQIAVMVAGWPVEPAPDEGSSSEVDAWEAANAIAGAGATRYGLDAGRVIADQAVTAE
ncbi:MAG: hypothetical protein ABIK89_24605 [Planctomycetota bacterium]